MDSEGVQDFAVFFDRIRQVFGYTQCVYVEFTGRGKEKRIPNGGAEVLPRKKYGYGDGC